MVAYLLDFHENIRFSKTFREYQEQPYPLKVTTIVFLDPSKKMRVTFVGHSWNKQRIFLYINIPGTLFGNIPRNFIGNFFQIYWEYLMGMFNEYSTNIYLPGA